MQWKAGVYRTGEYLQEGCADMTDIATHMDEKLLVRGKRKGDGGGCAGKEGKRGRERDKEWGRGREREGGRGKRSVEERDRGKR